MAYTPVPSESKSKINRAGKILVSSNVNSAEYEQAQELANRWRACHAYPINTFQATLRTKLIGFSGVPIVAQRLKRMPTLIDKLSRHPNMQLTTMQDIGGIRAILDDVDDVYRIIAKYVDNKNFPHEFIEKYDYIENPRSEDGYRSIHLVYKYKNKVTPLYDGLRVEIQVRTKLQHTWATAVETMGTFLGQALKSRQGDKDWLDFFCLTSSAFSYIENTNPIPRFSHLDKKQTFDEVASLEKKLGALDKMKSFSIAVDSISKSKGYTYHLLILDSLNHTITIQPYDRDSLDIALAEYNKVENQAAQGSKLEPVLVSAGPMETLKKAYPNLFLDITEFEKIIKQIIN
jgi:ppGpp synthetase/RelA/SpoT-type nucleotidyltranferase